jgi:hypothetical protein
LPDAATVVPGALDRFVLDLVEAGFETRDGRVWRGPIDPALADLTTASEMVFVIPDGWPYRHPKVFVDGLRPSVHLNESALCLWRVGDDSLAWMRLDDLRERIGQWSERYRGRATLDDPVLDPHLYWVRYDPKILATVDLSKIHWGNGGSGDARANLKDGRLEIGDTGDARVRWYGREGMRHPPVNMSMITDGLKKEQAQNLEREFETVGRSGGLDVLMLIWDTPVHEPNVLVLGLTRGADGDVVGAAYEVARIDTDVLIRRAGPDAPTLRDKSIIVFGQGAIGSNLDLMLARSGLGLIVGVDGERLRPGDLVRHAALRISVGDPKVGGIGLSIRMAAPWTEFRPINNASWDPDAIAAASADKDLVIDAVGEATYTEQLSRRLADTAIPLLSVALFRGGAVGRVRVQAPGGMPIYLREDSGVFPIIPRGALETVPTWETGCASPVNNAPPAAVVSVAALGARIAVEILAGREAGNFDSIEVYRALESTPFDRVGYLRHDG